MPNAIIYFSGRDHVNLAYFKNVKSLNNAIMTTIYVQVLRFRKGI